MPRFVSPAVLAGCVATDCEHPAHGSLHCSTAMLTNLYKTRSHEIRMGSIAVFIFETVDLVHSRQGHSSCKHCRVYALLCRAIVVMKTLTIVHVSYVYLSALQSALALLLYRELFEIL